MEVLPIRSESWPSWLIGLIFGGSAGLMTLLGGAPFLFVSLALLTLAFVVARSFAFLSGAFVALGGAWLGLTIRAQLACDAFDAAANQGCTGFGVEPFVAVSASILVVGVVLGALASRRRSGQASSSARS